ALALLSMGTSAVLAAPKGVFARFAQCPTAIPAVAVCQYVEMTSGELSVGPVKVPVDKTIVFQGGAIPTGGVNPNEYFLVSGANGESASPTELDLPGGLRTILGCPQHDWDDHSRAQRRGLCAGRVHRGKDDGVTVTIEGVAAPSNPAILNLAAFFL